MFPVSVQMDEEHVESLEMALAALQAELKVCERWGPVTTRHKLAIDDLHELVDRAQRASKIQAAKDPVGTVIQLMRTGRPW